MARLNRPVVLRCQLPGQGQHCSRTAKMTSWIYIGLGTIGVLIGWFRAKVSCVHGKFALYFPLKKFSKATNKKQRNLKFWKFGLYFPQKILQNDEHRDMETRTHNVALLCIFMMSFWLFSNSAYRLSEPAEKFHFSFRNVGYFFLNEIR